MCLGVFKLNLTQPHLTSRLYQKLTYRTTPDLYIHSFTYIIATCLGKL